MSKHISWMMHSTQFKPSVSVFGHANISYPLFLHCSKRVVGGSALTNNAHHRVVLLSVIILDNRGSFYLNGMEDLFVVSNNLAELSPINWSQQINWTLLCGQITYAQRFYS